MKKRAVKVVELGCAGHLIVAKDCAWRRHTQIGTKFRVSTVGNYFSRLDGKRQTLGADDRSFFETMVFETTRHSADGKSSEGCGCHEVKNWSEIDIQRYATAGEAQAGHEKFVATYKRKAVGL